MHQISVTSTRTPRYLAAALLTCLALSGMSCSKQNHMATSPTAGSAIESSLRSQPVTPPAADLPVLGSAGNFAVLGASTVTSTGLTVLTGDLGVSPGTAITGFGPGVVSGVIHAGDPVAAQAQADLTTGYNALAAMACGTALTGQDLGGRTLPPGVYCFASSAELNGTLVLDAQGNPDAVFLFQIGSTLTTATNSAVVLINGGRQCNVFWQVGSSATLGTGTTFVGNVIAVSSITIGTGVELSGRALARAGAVTMDTDTVSTANCGTGPPVVPCRQRVTGEGSILVPGGSASFAFSVRQKRDGSIRGALQFVNHVQHLNLSVRDFTSLMFTNQSATFVGSGTLNGVPGVFTITVMDLKSSSAGDRFSITGPGGLSESGTLKSGDIRIRDKHCGNDKDDDEGDDDDSGDNGHGDDHGKGNNDKGGKGGHR